MSESKPTAESRKARQERPSLIQEFWEFVVAEKAWWMTPIVVISILLGLLAWAAGTGAAPFIYALF